MEQKAKASGITGYVTVKRRGTAVTQADFMGVRLLFFVIPTLHTKRIGRKMGAILTIRSLEDPTHTPSFRFVGGIVAWTMM
jgi:hypothetical protein